MPVNAGILDTCIERKVPENMQHKLLHIQTYKCMLPDGVHMEHDSRYDFDYLKPHNFHKLMESAKDGEDHFAVIGYVRLHKIKNNKACDKLVIRQSDKDDLFLKLHLSDNISKIYGIVKGYAYVGDGRWVAILSFPVILLLLLLLIIFMTAFKACNGNVPIDDVSKPLEFEQNMPIADMEPEAIVEMIDIPGFTDLQISDSNPSIKLKNPENNTVHFIYRLSENGNVIHETKAIQPGNMAQVNLASLLSKGEHNVLFEIMTYDVDTKTACNGSSQLVKVVVK